MKCGSGLSKGFCLICASRYGNNPNLNSLNDSPNISENVSQSPPHIDHHCCYECGDSLDGIFCQRCTCKSCGNDAHYGYNCPLKVPIISNPEPCNNQTVDELPQTLPSFDPTCYSRDGSSFTYDSTPNFVNDSPNVFNPPPQPPMYSFGGIDTDILLTIKDDILREKLLNVILLIAKIGALKDNLTPSSDFVTKSSSTSPNFFLEETNTFDNSLPEFETFCFNLEEKSSGSTTILSDYSLSDYEVFYLDEDHIKEKSSGSTTTHADFSQYDSFIFDLSINPFPPADRSDFYHEEFVRDTSQSYLHKSMIISLLKDETRAGPNSTMDVMEDIFDNPTRKPRVHVPNVLPNHPTLHLDLDFTISSDSLGSDLVVSFPSGTRNKIFDPGIFIRVKSKIFLSRDAFSISFIRDPLFLVIDTLLPFSSENEDKVVNTGIFAAGEKQFPHLLSHRGLKALNESPMMIHGENTPNLGLSRIFEASRAHGVVHRSLELQILSFIREI
ncbi:hypothetical protein Tco_0318976 [Tanacetum coccineum]